MMQKTIITQVEKGRKPEDDRLALTTSTIVESDTEAPESSVTKEVTLKELLQFSLRNIRELELQSEAYIDAAASAALLELQSEAYIDAAEWAAFIVSELVEKIWLVYPNGSKIPVVNYNLIDVSRYEIVLVQYGIVSNIPGNDKLVARFNYFHELVRDALQSDPVQFVLSGVANSIVQPTSQSKAKVSAKKKPISENQLAPRGSDLSSGSIKMGLHALRQSFGDQKQLPSFKDGLLDRWHTKYGTPVDSQIDRYGIDLTDLQYKVMEGILKGFSQTNYEGNVSAKTKDELLKEFKTITAVEQLPRIYGNIEDIPKIRVQQRELMRLCGSDQDNSGEYTRTMEALNYLATTQFCFYYTRLAFDSTGKPERDEKTGDFKKETVEAIDTLFDVKTVRDEVSGEFKFYEIEPSPIFLDQYKSYYLLIPYGWREEVKKVIGSKKASSYTMRFLLYLRYQFEEKRRKNVVNIKGRRAQIPYEIKASWVDIAIALKMPESVYKGQKGRATKAIDQAYQVALRLGYLISYAKDRHLDTLILNPDKYHSPAELPQPGPDPTQAKLKKAVKE